MVPQRRRQQQWQFVDSGNGYYRLKSRLSGKVLDVSNRSTADGAGLIQWSDGNGTNQQFSIQDIDGYIQLIARHSGKAVEVQGASTADGANIVQYSDWNGTNQQWQLVRLGGSNPTTPPPSGTFTNPVVWQDFADGDIIRVGDAYYYSASTMHYSPGAPILRSYDLVSWEYAGHSVPRLEFDDSGYDLSGGRKYVKGIWASTLGYRRSNSTYYWLGCTEFNRTYVYTASAVDGTWTKKARLNQCYYDAGLLVDDNDTMYVAYGNGTISVAQLNADGTAQVRAQQVFQTPSSVGTLEGARFYKRNGYYYIWLTRPANGQYVLRSSSPFGPYEMRQVLLDLPGPISGGGVPHQGGIVQTQAGDWWYMAFTDAYPGGGCDAGADQLERRRVALGADRQRPLGQHVQPPEHHDHQDGRVDDRPGHVRRSHAGPPVGVEPQPGHQPVQRRQRAPAADRHGHERPVQRAEHPDAPHPGSDVDSHRRAGLLRHGERRPVGARDAPAVVGVDRRGQVQRDHPRGDDRRALDEQLVGDHRDRGRTRVGDRLRGPDLATGDRRHPPGLRPDRHVLLQHRRHDVPAARTAFVLNNQWEFFMGYRFGIFNYATQALGGAVTVRSFDLTTP